MDVRGEFFGIALVFLHGLELPVEEEEGGAGVDAFGFEEFEEFGGVFPEHLVGGFYGVEEEAVDVVVEVSGFPGVFSFRKEREADEEGG